MNKTAPTLIRENAALRMLGLPLTAANRKSLRARLTPEIACAPRLIRLYRVGPLEELRATLDAENKKWLIARTLIARTLDAILKSSNYSKP